MVPYSRLTPNFANDGMYYVESLVPYSTLVSRGYLSGPATSTHLGGRPLA